MIVTLICNAVVALMILFGYELPPKELVGPRRMAMFGFFMLFLGNVLGIIGILLKGL